MEALRRGDAHPATDGRDSSEPRYIAEALQRDRGNSQLRDMLVSAAEGTALKQRASGDRDGALATLLSAKAETPDSFPLLLDLSILEDELRLFRNADRDAHEARLIHPEDPKALYAEARVKMDLQDIPAAERDMRAYLKARPDDATAHYGLGRILQMTQQSDAAKAEFDRSITLAPNQAESYYQIGQMALDHGSYSEAQQQCRKALEHDPKHGGALRPQRPRNASANAQSGHILLRIGDAKQRPGIRVAGMLGDESFESAAGFGGLTVREQSLRALERLGRLRHDGQGRGEEPYRRKLQDESRESGHCKKKEPGAVCAPRPWLPLVPGAIRK
jgi:tetratricopeptide (TPR) repeat protein